MIHGYFGNRGHHAYPNPETYHRGYESHNNRPYDPQGSMTAFAAGNTISTGSSYYGGRGGGGGGGGGLDCRNCESAKKPANGNGTKKNGNGPSNGNGRSTNGKEDHQQEVPSDIPATDANGQEQTPIWNQDVGRPNGNGNGDYLGDQPVADEVPKGDTLPAASPNVPADPDGAMKGKTTYGSRSIPVFDFLSGQGE